MFPQETYERWATAGFLLVGDATRTIVAAPSGNRKKIVVTHLHLFSLIAAAQITQVTIGTLVLAELPATWTAGFEFFFGPCIHGLSNDGSALLIVPAAAGPRIHYVAEGYYL